MRLLLDTHVLLWIVGGGRELHADVIADLQDPDHQVMVSVATIWEMAIKQSIGKLEVPDDLGAELAFHGFDPLDITSTHASGVRDLPLHHRDPFDRLLISQARVEGLTLVTHDAALGAYDVSLRMV